jgi:methyl-accepting chemotaxis protein
MFKLTSLRALLLSTHLSLAMVPLIVIGFVSYLVAANIIKQQSFNQLTAVNTNKQAAITSYFDNIRDQVTTYSHNLMVVDALHAFTEGYDNINTDNAFQPQNISEMRVALKAFYRDKFAEEFKRENDGESVDIDQLISKLDDNAVSLQYLYIATNSQPLGSKFKLTHADDKSRFSQAHAKFHPVLQEFQQAFGLYDLFLIDAATGHVIYTVFKEIDFASNLKTGAYAASSLGTVIKQLDQDGHKDNAALSDFTRYIPSYNAPASFIAAPIYDNDTVIGYLAFQIPIDRINLVMSLRAGMGESGESYLVGSDLLMRSDSYLDPEQHSVVASIRHPQTGAVDTQAAHAALAGNSGAEIITDYNNNPVLSAYAPIDILGLKWAILTEIDVKEAFAGIYTLRIFTVLFVLLIAGICTALAHTISRSIARPLIRLTAEAQRISDGSLDVDFKNGRTDEIGQLAQSLQEMQTKIKAVIQSEITPMVKQASLGNLTSRINTQSKTGFYLELATNLNQLIEVNADFLADSARVISAMAHGDLSCRATTHHEGSFAAVQKDLESMRSTLETIITQDVQTIINQASSGNLTGRISLDKKPGCYLNLAKGINQLVDINQAIIRDIGMITSAVSNGDLTARATQEYDGSFRELIQNIEGFQKKLDHVINGDIHSIVLSANQGNLKKRIDLSNKQGFYRTLAASINDLVATNDMIISDTSRVVGAIAQGDLTDRIITTYAGTFEELKENVNSTADTLSNIVQQIRHAAETVDSGVREISTGNMDLSNRTERQSASLEETSAAMEEMAASLETTAHSAEEASEKSQQSAKYAEDGGKVLNDAISAMEMINKASDKIAEIITVINDIAFQTNLLALNASVEAARAGDKGRGFSVVADEVRILAGRSATASREIEALIKDSCHKVREGRELVNRSGGVLTNIIGSVKEVNAIVDSMSSACDEQSQGLNEITKALMQIDENTQQNSAMVEETAAASTSLNEQTTSLFDLVKFFHLNENTHKAGTHNVDATNWRPAPNLLINSQ